VLFSIIFGFLVDVGGNLILVEFGGNFRLVDLGGFFKFQFWV